MITVSMPVYNTPGKLLDRAVRSVLAQTYRDFVLVVVNDGGTLDLSIEDSRLVVVQWAENRGRYYTDAVVSRATQTEWFTAHDSDDWSDPDRFEKLLDGVKHDVVAGAVTWHFRTGKKYVHAPSRIQDTKFRLRWHNSAFYRTESVREWIHPGIRLGWDQATSSIGAQHKVKVVNEPLYHWEQRVGSLTQASQTRRGTSARNTDHRNARLAYTAYLQGTPLPEPDPEDVEHVKSCL